ncbi:hypothetical protein QJS10_CPB13g01357 [Acorus calamus]|uniref:FAD-binding domain-containing protein n=1 Tax=Acorus calamus TaxID=4465 RepID=A0AAV9DHV2_ACOCL|nr:hypothetical protein QJS10_CPB13g01357 [Acorus calamus]
MESFEEVVIVGGGIAGLATAVALKRVGVRSLVLERSHELRATGGSITLAANAWRALEAIGVAGKLVPLYSALKKSHFTNLITGDYQEVSFPNNGVRDELGIRAVHRKVLLQALAEELPSDAVRFSSRLESIKEQIIDRSSVYTLQFEDGSTIRAKVVIGCDGVHSVVARWLGLTAPVRSGRSVVRAIAVFPNGHGFEGEVQQFLDVGKRAGIVPLNDKEVMWFMAHTSLPPEIEKVRDPESIQKLVIENLAKGFPQEYIDVVHYIDPTTITWAPLMFRYPWDLLIGQTWRGCVTVAGDAMHPMTPDLGQGGCTALEDAVVLARHIASSRSSSDGFEKAIEGYVKERRVRVAGIIVGSYLSGWVQQGGVGWWQGSLVRFVRDHIFYRFVFQRLLKVSEFDCGRLTCE